MTRGKEANHVYVATDQAHLEEHQYREDLKMSARSVLYGILQHQGTEVSAHETIIQEHEDASSISQLAGEYETIAVEAQTRRWVTILTEAGLSTSQLTELTNADSFGPLSMELRKLEAVGHHVDRLLGTVTRAGQLEDIDDLGSLLRYRVTTLADRFPPAHPPTTSGLIAGLLPRATGRFNSEDQKALDEREELIENRAQALVHEARTTGEPWITQLPEPVDPDQEHALIVVAAYRDRWQITSQDPIGPLPDDDGQRVDYHRAQSHLAALTSEDNDEMATPTAARSVRRDSRSL